MAPITVDHAPTARARKPWTKTRIAVLVGIVAVVSILGFAGLVALYLGASNSLVDRSVPASAAWGDCYNSGNSQQPVDCNGPHHYEVYSLLEYADDTPYPNFVERRLGDELCEDDFETYTGDNFFTSDFDFAERYPSRDEWEAGNRVTVCVLFHTEFKRIDAPVGNLDSLLD